MPEDFGLVAMAVVIAGLAQMLLNFGTDLAILRDKNAETADFNTAWTLRVIQSSAISLLIFLSAPFVAAFYEDDRLTQIVEVIALVSLINGFENIGVTLFRKEFNYSQDFLFNFINKAFSVTITIILALTLRNYWALVISQVIAAVSATSFSYILSSYRPRFTLSRIRSIFSFSQWILVIGLAHFVQMNGDRAIFGRLFAAAELGIYTVAKEIALMVTAELTLPITRALLPTMAQLTGDMERFSRALLATLGGAMSLAVPAAVGLIVVAPEFVLVLLGSKWTATIPFLQLLTIGGLIQVYVGLCANTLLVLSQGRVVAIGVWLQSILIIVIILAGYSRFGMTIAPYALILAASVPMFIYSGTMIIQRVLGLADLFLCLWRPITASAIMAWAILYAAADLDSAFGVLVVLIFKVAVGAICYTATLLLLWIVSGRPDGLERKAVDKFLALVRRRTAAEASTH